MAAVDRFGNPVDLVKRARADLRPKAGVVPTNLEAALRQQIQTLSQSPFDPQFGPAPKFVAPERPEFVTDRPVPFQSQLDEAIAGIRGRETATSAGELAGLKGLFKAADPTLRLQKAREFISKIVGPRNEAAAIRAGFGRGPAALEATTRAGAELALPIVTEAGRQEALANQFKVALEQARFSREQSQQRELFESVLNKVNAGISIESLNAQERQVLAQFNLSAAGQESQFNLATAGLQSEQEVARSNTGLSTQDRTLALLNQLRTIRTSQAQINAGLRPSSGGSRQATPSLSGPPEVTDLQRAQTNFLNTRSEATRVASLRAGKIQPGTTIGLPGVLTSGGINDPRGTGAAPSTVSSIASRIGATPSVTTRKPLTGVSQLFA